MTELFYRRSGAIPPPAAVLPEGLDAHWWRPARDGWPRPPFRSRSNRMWYGIDRLGLFARHDFAALIITQRDQPVFRLIVTPRWYRFPDMATRDLQTGDLWTHPDHRGQGLALHGMQCALATFAGRYDAMWYIAEADNVASVRVAEKLGFTLAGDGVRTAPFGIAVLGRFRLSRAAAGAGSA